MWVTNYLRTASLVCLLVSMVHSAKRPNVLLILSDDLVPMLDTYMDDSFPAAVYPDMYTPNLDTLAAKSLLLRKVFCQFPRCSPSRTSFLTARRPDTTNVYNNGPYWRDVGGNFTTLPQYFKEHGYWTLGMGKIYHLGEASGFNDPISWSEEYYEAPNYDYYMNRELSWNALTEEEIQGRPLPDMQVADEAIRRLHEFNNSISDQPFMIAAGFHKPHLPFIFPENFLDYYPNASIPMNPFVPIDVPQIAWWDNREILNYQDIQPYNIGDFNTTLPDHVTISLRRAYYSTVSFIDTMVGRVLSELTNLGLDDNTIIIFGSDHGYELGEHAQWGKGNTYDLPLQVPLMIHVPGLTDAAMISDNIVELIDLFPTIVEAAGLPQLSLCPDVSADVSTCTEGKSFLQLANPNGNITWVNRAFAQRDRNNGAVMGQTIRTPEFRYTEWVDWVEDRPDWGGVHGVELYNLQQDQFEDRNVAEDPAYTDVVAELSSELHQGWRNAFWN